MYITYTLILQNSVFPAAIQGHSLARLGVISVNLLCFSGRINSIYDIPKRMVLVQIKCCLGQVGPCSFYRLPINRYS